ncbi:MAG: hypothetical protein RLZZ401_265 [Pseudomonadota bacterium]|jgi:general secretion pathway protein M
MSVLTISLHTRWQALVPRERAGVQLAALLVALALLWWLLLAPAWQTLRTADLQRRALDLQVQQMRALQAQAQALKSAPPLTGSEAARALEAAVKQRLGASAQLNVVGERASVTLKGASPEALAQWLAQVRVNAHALPLESHLVRSGDAGGTKWDGTVVLRLP